MANTRTQSASKSQSGDEPGIIGQTYEHRKTHKSGVLDGRETKYKTLTLRDSEGGTFSVAYSTFRRDWRKSESVEDSSEELRVPEPTFEETAPEPQVEVSATVDEIVEGAEEVAPEAKETAPEAQEKSSEAAASNAHTVIYGGASKEEMEKAAIDAKAVVDFELEQHEKNDRYSTKIGGRGGRMSCVRVKLGRKNVFELWMMKDTFQLFMRKELSDALKFPPELGESLVIVHEKFNLTHEVVFRQDVLADVVKLVVRTIQ